MIAGSKSLATPRSVLTGLQPSFAKMGTNSPAAAMKALTSIRISGFDIKGHETDVSHERSDLTGRLGSRRHLMPPSRWATLALLVARIELRLEQSPHGVDVDDRLPTTRNGEQLFPRADSISKAIAPCPPRSSATCRSRSHRTSSSVSEEVLNLLEDRPVGLRGLPGGRCER